MIQIGKAIKVCRTQKNMKQAELAELANISISYLSLLERGKRDPTLSTIQSIVFALDIPFSILMFLADEKTDLAKINLEVAEKLSYIALQVTRKK